MCWEFFLFLQLYIEDRSFVQNRVSYYLLCFTTVDILSRMEIVDYMACQQMYVYMY